MVLDPKTDPWDRFAVTFMQSAAIASGALAVLLILLGLYDSDRQTLGIGMVCGLASVVLTIYLQRNNQLL